MSGFAVALRLGAEARGAPDGLLDAPLFRMRHRGPEGCHRLQDGPAALAQLDGWHDICRPGPRASRPVRLRQDGPVLVGDLALLEGEQLAAAAGTRYRGDAEAVLAAYDRWGNALGDHLEGEFALVIWDPARRSLLALRDRFGVKPLAYRSGPGLLLIASEPAALDDDTSAPDARWIGGFLAGEESDAALTPFAGVRRLAPGHRLHCAGATVREDRWWRPEPTAIPEAEAPEALAEALERAVRARTSADCTTLLSGGLDSSTVTCLAARASHRPVRALSMRYAEMPELDEGRYIDAVRACGNILGVDAQVRGGDAFASAGRGLCEQGFPVFAPNQTMLSQTHDAARAIGARTLLDGHGGDEVIGTGSWYFGELAYEKRWRTLWRALQAEKAASGSRSSSVRQMIEALSRHGPAPIKALLRWTLPAGTEPRLVDPRATAQSADAVTLAHEHLPPACRAHARILLNPGTALAFEYLDRAASHAGLQHRFPFYDRHVVAITLGQPSRAKHAPGQPRALLRRAMRGILPEPVRTRADKTDFTPGILSGFGDAQRARLETLATAPPEPLAQYLDRARLRDILPGAGHDELRFGAISPLMRLLLLDAWLLERHGADASPRKVMP